MEIDNLRLQNYTNQFKTEDKEISKKTSKSKDYASSVNQEKVIEDKVSLSQTKKVAMSNTESIDNNIDKIEQYRNAIKEGMYKVNPEKIASKIFA